ncbi:chitinase [Methanolacinia paynteri]|uniref:chitinase n=1 Tax=Methanolacinia paynteri TaxID=230356 RepID=UPI0006949458|nr:chitinase [Methanolacinia paynteri]
MGSLCLPAAASTDWPDQVYAPYIDISLTTDPEQTIVTMADDTGVMYYTCCFVTGDDNNNPIWGWRPVWSNNGVVYYKDKIDALRAKGGDVIISFGGADAVNTELAIKIKDVSKLTDTYRSVIDAYDVNYIDFDIEGPAQLNYTANDRRNQAIVNLQKENPNLKVSFTLAVTPNGLHPDGMGVLTGAKDAGVRIDRVNIMLMDYGPEVAPPPTTMGEYGIMAANGLHGQLKQLYPDKTDAEIWKMIGLTPMIGQNDQPAEVFYPDDARLVAGFAGEKGIGLMSIWSATRDNGNCGRKTQADPLCSGIPMEQQYEFSNIFKNYASMRPSATPAPISSTVWPDQFYAPYIDYGLTRGCTINEAYASTGVKYYTCCFITANTTTGVLGFADKNVGYRLSDIETLRANGGDVIISFGGAGGQTTEPAIVIKDLNSLVDAYSSVIETYGVNYIDFDIEGVAVTNQGANSRRSQAIIKLKEKYSDLKVSVTLAATPKDGLPTPQIAYLNDAKSAEDRYKNENPGKDMLIFDRVNIMLMDYGTYYVTDPDNMGGYAIDAANVVHDQLKSGYYSGKSDAEIWKRMGLTPMIGQNDMPGEVFYPKDATQLAEFAGEKGVGMMSIWSLTRDNGNCGRESVADPLCSGIVQDPFEFSNIIKNYPTMRPSATETETPTPEPTHATGLITPTPTRATGLIPEWSSDKEYDTGDIVLYKGSMYAARWWTMDEEPGIEYVWLSTSGKLVPKPDHAKGLITHWNSDDIYLAGDTVIYDDGVYSAKWLTMGEKPGETYVWELTSEIEPEVPVTETVMETETPATGLIPVWDSKTEYDAGDTVLYKGKTYTARWWNVAEPPGHTYSWISDAGEYMPTPTPSSGPAKQWDSRKAYAAGDMVIYNYNRYRASWMNRGEVPGVSYVWELAPEEPTPSPTQATGLITPTPTYSKGLITPTPTHATGLITPNPTPATGLLGG